MDEIKDRQKLSDIARKKRYLSLVEKLQGGKPLSKSEIRELEEFEAEPLEPTVVKSMEEVAKVMDVSYRTVQRWKKDGMPVMSDGYYDLEAIRAWHDGRPSKGAESEGKAYWDEKIRKYKAALLRIELKRAEGEVVLRDDVERGRIERIMAVKRSFLAMPTRLAPLLAMKEPREIETALYEAVGEIIDEFAGSKHDKTSKRDMDKRRAEGVETA